MHWLMHYVRMYYNNLMEGYKCHLSVFIGFFKAQRSCIEFVLRGAATLVPQSAASSV